MFGMRPEQVDQAGPILQELATDWRSLVAGSEGFLTEPGRVGVQSQAVAWGEQDSMGHVNNVQYVRYAETGRCNWIQNLGAYFDRAHQKEWGDLLSSRNVGLILRSITVDFKFPMTWPDCISVYHKLRSRPTRDMDSMMLDVTILSEVQQRPAARCLEDCVVYNYRQGKKSTIPGFMFDQLVKAFDLQEASKERNTRRVMSLLDRVTSLEKQTWDRRDAKEDFGTSLR
jgi:acyl-CoA thioesterase FadM